MLKNLHPLKNKKGMAVMELIPIMFVYMLLINFSLGLFGVVHSGILHSIAARNYTFETFAHRSNLVYHIRPRPDVALSQNNYERRGLRYSGIVSEGNVPGDVWAATARPIAFTSQFGGTDNDGTDLAGRGPARVQGEAQIHNVDVIAMNEAQRNETVAVKSVWIKTIYGICMTAACGDP
jgi:hypothetical protein